MTTPRSLLTLAGLALMFAACSQSLQPEREDSQPRTFGAKTSGGGSTANPQIVGMSSQVVKNVSYHTVAVMDSDGGHLTHLYSAPYAGTPSSLGSTTWSPDGSAVCFIDGDRAGTTFTNRYLKRMNVTVTNGVPVATNLTTLYSNVNMVFTSASWCSLTATNKIAFVVNVNTGGSSFMGYVYTIPATGGTPTLVHSDTMRFASVRWSANDQQLIFTAIMSTTQTKMRIIDASTGAIVSEPVAPGFIVDNYSVARGATNRILYRYAPTQLSTPVAMMYDVASNSSWQMNSQQVLGTWSPRSDKILCQVGTSTDLQAMNPDNGQLSLVKVAGAISFMDWKR